MYVCLFSKGFFTDLDILSKFSSSIPQLLEIMKIRNPSTHSQLMKSIPKNIIFHHKDSHPHRTTITIHPLLIVFIA